MSGPWHTLVTAESLNAHLYEADLVLLDCRHDLLDPEAGRRAYEDGHLPGAQHAHIDRDLAGPVDGSNGRHPLPDPERFREVAGRWGIGPETQVVAYDDIGGAFAARAWWLLRYYGHDRVAVLDGGLPAWRDIGGPVSSAPVERTPTEFLGTPGHLPIVDAKSLERRIPVDGTLLDARDPARFRGEEEPIDPAPGHIPGAVNAPFQENLGPDGRFRSPDELQAHYERLLGGHAPDEVACYCGSGVTAAHDLLAMEIAHLRGAALYPGSWSEWCSDPSRAVETGGGSA